MLIDHYASDVNETTRVENQNNIVIHQNESSGNNRFNPELFLRNNQPAAQTANADSEDEDSSPKSSHRIDISKFIKKLESISATRSAQRCARSIRIALETAGARILNHPVAAADWGRTLTQIGYKQIKPAFDNPEKGDIYIINRTRGHNYGHIAGFTGTEWVSDFRQRSYDVYKSDNVSYQYYRLGL
ncbi:CHAP domain-containing protein [Acinetobacter sp. WZC-1]|uniref:CHAP domain-containing protein n=1 Tax=Acinetobacter sp. WZC-1 TaxID=3459034 RepID=UPI00403DEAC9